MGTRFGTDSSAGLPGPAEYRMPASLFAIIRIAATIAALVALGACSQSAPVGREPVEPSVASYQTYSYTRDVKPILEHKCIACHACYDAPCQLKLTSAEGLLRGATTQRVYDSSRLDNAAPTRLFVDAHGVEQWREKGFFSVLNDRGGPLQANLDNSNLYRMLELGRNNGLAPDSPVPDDIVLGLARETTCPAPDEFAKYAKDKLQQGMPLAIAGLTDGEYGTLRQWLYEGAVIDEQPLVPGPGEQERIDHWEAFFNEPTPRNRLVGRYLYEHLYPAHLYFDELETGNFFELVRSRTPSGQPVDVIATARPNDDPGPQFYYRLRPVEGTLVQKTHMPYALGPARMARYEKLFLESDWDVATLPDYSRANQINPVAAFDAIPPAARYQFMLDEAKYFVTTFIRGPVCAGQIATNVIEDRFFVLFQDPKSDLSVTDPQYLKAILPHLVLVPEQEGVVKLFANWVERGKMMNEYINLRGEYYKKLQPGGRSLDDIWYGDGHNTSAALTVFRNFDNAMVTRGFVGADPKTLWVMDYPMLERTYYLLVVNFNVFGSVATQAETRLYFDLIRANGENNFLHFMPPGVRTAMRDSWYKGSLAQLKVNHIYEIVNEKQPVAIDYRGDDPKADFIRMVAARQPDHAGLPDTLNRCAQGTDCAAPGIGPRQAGVEAALRTLSSRPAADPGMRFVRYMPDVAFLRVTDDAGGDAFAYTLIRDKAHANVAFMFEEQDRRERDQDRLTIYRGLLGSYPNFMFQVPEKEMAEFTATLHGMSDSAGLDELVQRWGLMRTNPRIWENFQWFVDYTHRTAPLEAGVYDLSRYKKVADLASDQEG